MDEVYRPTREERKESEALQNVNGPVGIRNGTQVTNYAFDQNLVISYLNQIPVARGGTLSPLGPTRFKATRDGFCDSSLFEAIRKFQQANGLSSDGVVDPGGATLRALRAGGGTSPGPVGPNAREQEFIDKAYSLIGLLRLLVNRRPTILTNSQVGEVRVVLSDLERLMARSGAKPRSQPLPVRNNALAIEIVVVVILICIAIVALAQDPAWRKAAKIMADGIVEAVSGRARRLGQLMEAAKDATVQTIVDGVVAINQKAHELTRKKQLCRPTFDDLERKATKLTFDLYHKPALVAQSIKAFLDALLELLRCLGADGSPLLEILRRGFAAGETLIDLLVKTMGGGNFILPVLRR